MATTFNLSNFSENNTPPKIQKLADLVLKICAAAIIVGGTIAAPPLALAVGGEIVMYAGVFGTMFKAISKLFGAKSE